MMEVVIEDRGGLPIPTQGPRLVVEEAWTYFLAVNAEGSVRVTLDGVPLQRTQVDGRFLMALGHAAGSRRLRVESSAGALDWRVEVRPRAEKLGPQAWMRLLHELESWLPGVALGAEGAHVGAVGTSGVAAPYLVEALAPLLPELSAALAAILEAPRLRAERQEIEEPLRRVRRVDRETLAWVSRHPQVGVWLRPWEGMDLRGPEPTVPQERAQDTLDHAVNRYVSWAVRAIAVALAGAAQQLERAARAAGVSDEGGVWCRHRASALAFEAAALRRQLRRSELGRLRPAPATEGALQVILDHPHYARFHGVARLFLSPRFKLEAEEADAPGAAIRPSYGLYELWCFLAVGRALKADLPGWSWEERRLDALLGVAGTGAGAELHGRQGSRHLQLLFNPTFAGYLSRRDQPRFSISGERRPDLALAYGKEGEEGRWLCLDAKYRTSAANLADSLTSAHIYRDALRWEGFGGRCRAAALLAPAVTDETQPWFEPAFLKAEGTGIFRLCPGEDAADLARWMMDVLGVEPRSPGGVDA